MHPHLFDIGGITITTYGFCLMVGFLTAVWFAMRRARICGADPDHIVDLAFVALLMGVAGSRVMYVLHYWDKRFADQPNKLLAIIDIRQGGLEFLGGLFGAAVAILLYLKLKKLSVRLYLDILAPGAMWGLAFGRLGCFFNGCCFGGLCPVPADPNAVNPPYAVEFPYGSLAHTRQWEERQITVPAELITTSARPGLLPATTLTMSVEKREKLINDYREALNALEDAKGKSLPEDERTKLQRKERTARRVLANEGLEHLIAAMRFPSREQGKRRTSPSELQALAAQSISRPVYATQIFSSIHAMILSLFLTAVFAFRKRHGLVIGLLFLMYPVARFLLESIRTDNPHDIAGLTISQSMSVAMMTGAAVYLFVLYRFLPETAPAEVLANSRPKEA
ncbi:MAG: prolipoprotein diacylglyceryl transferase [Phycisphaerae bacterium]